jgi:geranylgeranyl diphosphate synthase type II
LLSAVAVELLHNALLIHDDIEDGSEERRGRPTLHVLHGVPLALNAGDMLTLMSLWPLIENRSAIGSRLAMRIIEETERMARESAEGQALELGWQRDNTFDLDDADYMEMVLKKTCWLATIYPCRVGALIGTRDSIDLDPFIRFGFFLGTAFQIQDDLLNLIGGKEYGKERDGDLWEGKRTLMLIRLFREATPEEKEQLAQILKLSRSERTTAQVYWLRKLIDTYGCMDYARRIAHGLAGAAAHEFLLIFGDLPDSRDKQFMKD